jgi:N-acyl-D-amino-acid deacylase
MHLDLILSGGSVLDGTGAPAARADVGIAADRIAAVGDLRAWSARESVDVAGLVVAPGFIDVHTHSDLAPFLPESESDLRLASVRQGVTTEICGNCGFSTFPTLPRWARAVQRHLQALFGPEAESYESLEEYGQALAATPLVTNLAPLVGHGTVRAGVMGFDRRPATSGELDRMASALDDSLAHGGFGLSSGLIYPPGTYAPIEELVVLGTVAADHGRPYATHMRDETDRVQEAIDEALEIGRRSGVAVHISHHKVAGRRNWGRSASTLRSLDEARSDGIEVTIDVYPYTAASTFLHAILPPWTNEGGVDALLGRLRDSAVRARIAQDVASPDVDWQNFLGTAGWDNVAIATSPRHRSYEGRRISELAAERAQSPMDLVCDLVLEEEARVSVVLHVMHESDVRAGLRWGHAMIGSDGIPIPGKPHPRWAGTFARVLGEYCREQHVLSLPEAVHKMTKVSAQRFGLADRGEIAVGARADVVVFDPARVTAGATFDDPLARPSGVPHVLVNGGFVIRDAEATGTGTGRLLRPSDTKENSHV